MRQGKTKTACLLVSLAILILAGCSSSASSKSVYSFQMGKDSGENPSYFRMALTLYNQYVDFPGTEYSYPEESSTSSESVSSEAASSTSETSYSEDPKDSSIDALSYTNSFEFVLISKFDSASSSEESSSGEELSTSSESVSSEATSSEITSSDEGSSSDEEIIENTPMDFDFKGTYAIGEGDHLYFSIDQYADTKYGKTLFAPSIFAYVLNVVLYDDRVEVTIPVSFGDALYALFYQDETAFHTVTIALNKE